MRIRRRRNVAGQLADANKSLATATEARKEQAARREAEKKTIAATMDRLAEANHLGALVWNVITGRDGSES